MSNKSLLFLEKTETELFQMYNINIFLEQVKRR